REPESAVARPPPGRRPAVALGAPHPVGSAVDDGSDARACAVGHLVELLPGDPKDAAVAAHPEVAVLVLDDAVDHVVEQPLLAGDGGEAAVLQPVEPAAVGPDPQASRRVLVQREHEIVGEAVRLRVGREAAVLEPVEPAAPGPDPEAALAVL